MLEIHKGFVNDFLYVPLTVGYMKSRNSLFFLLPYLIRKTLQNYILKLILFTTALDTDLI